MHALRRISRGPGFQNIVRLSKTLKLDHQKPQTVEIKENAISLLDKYR